MLALSATESGAGNNSELAGLNAEDAGDALDDELVILRLVAFAHARGHDGVEALWQNLDLVALFARSDELVVKHALELSQLEVVQFGRVGLHKGHWHSASLEVLNHPTLTLEVEGRCRDGLLNCRETVDRVGATVLNEVRELVGLVGNVVVDAGVVVAVNVRVG